jgi:hypothetical protein
MKNRKLSILLACAVCLSACTDKNREVFQQQMKHFVNPNELQNWAVQILQTNEVGYEIPRSQWPNYLTVTNGPSSAWIAGWTTIKEHAVFMAWGNGFGHTGLIVGSTNFLITNEDLNSPVIQWIPGVYFASKSE